MLLNIFLFNQGNLNKKLFTIGHTQFTFLYFRAWKYKKTIFSKSPLNLILWKIDPKFSREVLWWTSYDKWFDIRLIFLINCYLYNVIKCLFYFLDNFFWDFSFMFVLKHVFQKHLLTEEFNSIKTLYNYSFWKKKKNI